MKKLIFGGFAVLLIFTLITCEGITPNGINDGPTTDVVYSADGTSVTLYLDGEVPVTKQSRALTKELAQAGHNFFEVVFYYVNASGVQVARSSWSIGEKAGVSNVPRTTAGINYGNTGAATIGTTAGDAYAVLFVGRKEDNTLLAIGKLSAATATVNNTTTSVTFEVQALTASLRQADGTGLGAATDTFLTSSRTPATTPPTAATTNLATATATVGGTGYAFPAYMLPKNTTTLHATYALGPSAAIGDYLLGVRVAEQDNIAGKPMADLKFAQFVTPSGTKYITGSTAERTTAVVTISAAGIQLPNPIPMVLTTADDDGFISLSFKIPVYAIHNNTAVAGVDNFITWYVRPGFGSSVYDLDEANLRSRGGSILLAVGTVSLNILDVQSSF